MTSNLYQTCTLGDLTVTAINRYRDDVAIIDEKGSFTYEQMGEQISCVIQVLKSLGLKRGDGIAQLSTNRPEVIFVMLAAGVMGLRYTPLHPLGSLDDHMFILKDAEISVLVIDEEKFIDRGVAAENQAKLSISILTYHTGKFGDGLVKRMLRMLPQKIVVESQTQDIAWIAYTGGTTGVPKGVVHKHPSLVTYNLMSMADWDWPPKPKYLAVTPLSHSAGVMVPTVLMLGGYVAMQSSFDPRSFLDFVEKNNISATFLVPTMIYALLNDETVMRSDLSSLELIIYGAAPMSPDRLSKAIDLFGPIFMQLYGQTEVPNAITVLSKNDHKGANLKILGSCGTPVTGNQVRLLDSNGNEVIDGDIGEICVRGPLIMDGYWKRPKETAKVFENDWLHTSDLARKDENGFFHIVDRSKDMIISGGFNIYPREVEDALMTHKAVSQVAIIGLPDDKWGEAVTAIIVLSIGYQPCQETLSAWVKEKKGSAHVPKLFKWVERIPLTSLGKLDKKALRKKFGN